MKTKPDTLLSLSDFNLDDYYYYYLTTLLQLRLREMALIRLNPPQLALSDAHSTPG